MLNIAICDDDAHFRNDLENHLTEYYKGKAPPTIHHYDCGQALLDAFRTTSFELVFLDIEMPEMDGVETGQKLRTLKDDLFLIFVTSHNIYYQQAFQLKVFQYIEKPVNTLFLEEEMERLLTAYTLNRQNYIVEYKGVKTKSPISKIVYLESAYWNIIVHTADKDFKMVGKLSTEEGRFKAQYFVRIHQSYLINMKYIKQFKSEEVLLWTGTKLPVSRKFKNTARHTFSNYLHKVGI